MLLQTWVCFMKQENGGMNNHWNIVKRKKKSGEEDTEKTGENTWYYNLRLVYWEENGLNLVMIH